MLVKLSEFIGALTEILHKDGDVLVAALAARDEASTDVALDEVSGTLCVVDGQVGDHRLRSDLVLVFHPEHREMIYTLSIPRIHLNTGESRG